MRNFKKNYASDLTEGAKIALGAASTLQDSRSAPSIHHCGGFLQSVFSFGLDFARGFKGASRTLQTLAKS